ncbi:alcohol oxidase [Phaeosphaeriaceae sp. SRC1lsM3a]|nr:alcohol oxidase [Stagonospora sp. SRC1lsM3a]
MTLLSLVASSTAQSSKVLWPFEIAASILDPVLETIGSTLRGDGLIDGTLGAIGGILGSEQTFDYIVVGGGTAGAGVGVRLAEAGFSVAIIEAGGFYEVEKPVFGTTPAGSFLGVGASPLDTVPTTDWGFNTEPQPHLNNRRIHYARGKCLGGSSALNFMVYHRGTTASYQKWADTVDDQSYTLGNLTPFFNRAVTFTPPGERSLNNVTTKYDASSFSNSGGPVQVGYGYWLTVWASFLEKAFNALGIQEHTEFNNGRLLGYHYSQSTLRSKDQTRSSSVAYIHAAGSDSKTSQNLKVFTHTQARRVLFDQSSPRPKASGVEVSALLGLAQYNISARREVILSAGAFQSPQLLMLSGIGPTDELSEHGIGQIVSAPGVGQNMWDHVLFGPSYSVKFPTVGSMLLRPVALASALVDYVTKAIGPLTYIADILGWEKLSKLGNYRNKFSESTLNALATFPDDWPEVEYIAADAYAGNFRHPLAQQPLNGKKYVSILGAMVAPLSRGNITLKSGNPLAAPAINPNWLSDPADQELAIAWYRRMREIFTTNDVASQLEEVGVEQYPGLENDSDEQILAVIRDSAITVWHASSTCRMGKSVLKNGIKERVDEMDVVDSEAKVFGVDGLRIVDASIFPFLPPGHPQSTIYALAEKISEAIIRDGSSNTS